MNKIIRSRIVFICVVALLIICQISGCRAMKKKRSKVTESGVAQDSYPLKMYGYQQTVTIKTTPDELNTFLNDPKNWFSLAGMEVKTKRFAEQATPSATRVGSSFPFDVKKMGIKVSGRMIVVRSTEEEMWYVFDNPKMINFQRWTMKPSKEGVRLTINLLTGAQDSELVKIIGEMGAGEMVNKEIDKMLAAMQAHFDPSVKPNELTAMGLRGESYEDLIQAYESRVHVDATPDKIEKWMQNPKNVALVMDQLNIEEKQFVALVNSRPGNIVYSPGQFERGVFKFKIETFAARADKISNSRIYLTALNRIGFIELHVKSETGGSLLTMKLVTEIPGSESGDMAGVMFFATGASQFFAERVMLIKNGVEKGLLK